MTFSCLRFSVSIDKINKQPGTISLIQNNVRWRSNWLDGTVGARSLGTKVNGDCQRETTHGICCLAAECFDYLIEQINSCRKIDNCNIISISIN